MTNRGEHETFTSVDAAWLHMDSPTNLAVITGVYTFDQPVDFERFKLTIERRLLPHPRFVQRAHPPALQLGLPYWEVDPHFDLDRHVRQGELPEPAGQAELQERVSRQMSLPLDPRRPLWQFEFFARYQDGSAVICRVHHAIADGLALVQLMLSIMDNEPDAALPDAPEDLPPAHPGLLQRLFRPAVKAVRSVSGAFGMAESLVHEGMDALVHPSRLADAARSGAGVTRALSKLLLIGPDRRTKLRGRCGVEKRAAWSANLDLEEVKAIGRLMGGTVNDVLLAAVTGALRRYLEQRGDATDGLNIRAIVPVNLRPAGENEMLGNRFGLVFLSLPVGIKDPLKRLITLRRRMDSIKDSPEAVVAISILGAIGMSPTQIENVIVQIFGMKGTAVMTNVPGPRQPLYFAGGKISSLMFWVPTPASLGLGVSIISYAGQVILGVATDAGLAPDPEGILEAFHDEIASLRRWGRPPAQLSAGGAGGAA
ncbi:MAG: WS/DGAT/MGAT family O-acyltransferase, partial [Chloroflexota bacterium]